VVFHPTLPVGYNLLFRASAETDNYLTMIDPHGAHTGEVMVRSEWEAVRERSDEAGLAAATSRDQAD
jgi:hypothetical protein